MCTSQRAKSAPMVGDEHRRVMRVLCVSVAQDLVFRRRIDDQPRSVTNQRTRQLVSCPSSPRPLARTSTSSPKMPERGCLQEEPPAALDCAVWLAVMRVSSCTEIPLTRTSRARCAECRYRISVQGARLTMTTSPRAWALHRSKSLPSTGDLHEVVRRLEAPRARWRSCRSCRR